MRRQINLFAVLLAGSSLALSGCFSSRPASFDVFTKPSDVEISSDCYFLRPPDEIQIRCSKVPEIHLQSQRIRPDGKVTFEGLGEIYAAGKTPEQLADIMREKIMMLYSLTGDHPIDVQIETYRSMFYYVLGQVKYPGPKIFTGRDTVLTALAASHPTHRAWVNRIQVVRPSAEENVKPCVFEFSYDRMVAHGDTRKNVLLEEGDIIFVPPTVLAAMGLTIDELLRPVGQTSSSVSYVQTLPSE